MPPYYTPNHSPTYPPAPLPSASPPPGPRAGSCAVLCAVPLGSTLKLVRRLGELSRHKKARGAVTLFPSASLSTIKIDIFGAAKKSEKKSGGRRGIGGDRCEIWGSWGEASGWKKLISEGKFLSSLGCTSASCRRHSLRFLDVLPRLSLQRREGERREGGQEGTG